MKTVALIIFFMLGFSNLSSAKSPPAPVIVDVRTPEEFADNHLKEAVNIDFRDQSFEAKISALSKEQSYVLYCRSGNRSGQAEKLMKSLGFKSVENLGSLQEAAKKLKKDCAVRPGC
ncbi:MAG: rhodanese-like domain-containing protein [Bdellovibrionales bacterium]|nr:rhodanese-like domain-containing protein [Bdellovibrionales bacterium]